MKIILSRKGFDSSYGGFPSPIFPNGKMFSIPIPEKDGLFRYRDLDFKYNGLDICEILSQITNNRIRSKRLKKNFDYATSDYTAHLDPQFYDNSNFRGYVLGQVKQAQSHLRNQGIREGDIFLFFGRFCKVEQSSDGLWKYKADAPDIHANFGWMQIGEICENVVTIDEKQKVIGKRPFLKDHPHLMEDSHTLPNNTVYVAKQGKLTIDGAETDIESSGRFTFSNRVCLSYMNKGQKYPMSMWQLPLPLKCDDKSCYSYMRYDSEIDQNTSLFKSPPIGQEIVVDCERIKEAHPSAYKIFMKFILGMFE